MQRTSRTLLYVVTLVALTAVLWVVCSAGEGMETGIHVLMPKTEPPAQSLHETVTGAFSHPLAVFIMQLALIITISQLCAFLFRKVGQPAVMGEIVAGIMLGPSLMGMLLPQLSAFIFPKASLGNLQMLSQVGVILFMFVIGIDLDMDALKRRAGAAMLISYFSIIIPFGLGVGLSYFIYAGYAPAGIPFYAFSLFMGIALSITAFPVLARIIRERNMSGSNSGIIALTAAAVGDVAAWCILAFIIAIVQAGSVMSSLYTIIAAVVYVCIMILAVRPVLNRLAARSSASNVLKRPAMAIVFVVLLLSAWCCEVIGIHALFGAFLAGTIMPSELQFRKALIDKVEDVALVLLLPLFFVSTGLRTQIGLLNGSTLWLICMAIILVAVVGKFGGSTLAARITGQTPKDSLSIGALMNTRGLVELVVLNIGYDLHIISDELFAMMVVMALVTTLMTNPLLNLINRVYK